MFHIYHATNLYSSRKGISQDAYATEENMESWGDADIHPGSVTKCMTLGHSVGKWKDCAPAPPFHFLLPPDFGQLDCRLGRQSGIASRTGALEPHCLSPAYSSLCLSSLICKMRIIQASHDEWHDMCKAPVRLYSQET